MIKRVFLNNQNIFLLFALFCLTLFKILYSRDIDFFIDELIVNSRGFWDIASIRDYTLHNSYHPPLTFLPHYLFNKLWFNSINLMRFSSVMVASLSFLFIWKNIFRSKVYLYLFLFLIFNMLIASFSMIITNYIYAFFFLLLFLMAFMQQKENSQLYWLACITFFFNYLAGFLCLCILLIDFLLYRNHRDAFKFTLLQVLILLKVCMFFIMQYYIKPFELFMQLDLLFTLFILKSTDQKGKDFFSFLLKGFVLYLVQVKIFKLTSAVEFELIPFYAHLQLLFLFLIIKPQSLTTKSFIAVIIIKSLFTALYAQDMDYYILIAFGEFLTLIYIFKREYFQVKFIPLQIIYLWLAHKALFSLTIIDVVREVYKPVNQQVFELDKFFPYIILGVIFSILMVIAKLNKVCIYKNNKVTTTLFVSLILNVIIFLSLTLYGKTIYTRYFFFLVPVVLILCSYYLHKINKSSVSISLLSLYIVLNLIYSPKAISYLGLQNHRSVFDKITENGKYSNFILMFTNNIDWHKYYLKKYRIYENFELHHFETCDNEKIITKVMQMAGRNAFITSYDFECPQIGQKIMEMCPLFDSKCFDLGAKDATVILKIFEPQYQEQKIKDLESLYSK